MSGKSNHQQAKIFLLIFCLLGIFTITVSLSMSDFSNFATYCKQFNKTYSNAQYGKRQQIYYKNLQYIVESNCSGLGVNMFSDMSIDEMNNLKGGIQANVPQQQIPINSDSLQINPSGLALTTKTPLSYDWRDYNAVTPIKYQGGCGGCWAFSTAAFFQSDLIISSNYTNHIDLSQQYLLKCDNRSLQCGGGFLFWAMNRVIDGTKGLPTENQYPYNYQLLGIQNGMCYETDLIKVDANKKQVAYFNIEDTRFIQQMILKKPVNVNLCSKDLQFYSPISTSRTLFCTSNATRRDHTVLLIGYTETEWIIKNQWSTSWGVDGYGYISKNSDSDCCIGKQLYTTGVVTQNCNVTNCQICVQETSCYKCNAGYYVMNQNSTHICAKCTQPNCQKCLNFYGVCDICQEGYTVAYPTYTCQLSNVTHCNFMYSGNCAECHQGYMLDTKGQCVSEELICYVPGCQQCKSYSPTICINCSAGYVLNKVTSLCEAIPMCVVENCSRCVYNNANKCEVCSQQGYEFSQTQGKCVPKCPIQGCQSCIFTNNNTTTQCALCQPGYNLSSDNLTCQKCQIQYCSDCSNNINFCVTCVAGFYFNSTTQKCQSCSGIDKNCIECSFNSQSNKLICTKCNNGFTVSENKTTCLRCLSDCSTCSYSSLTICSSQCGPTNYFSQSICNSCPQNCQSCQSNNSCLTCLPGFVLQNGLCYKMCKQGAACGYCQLGINNSVCGSCSGGYTMQNGSCVFDPTYSCLAENGLNPANCSSCPQKYFLNSSFPRVICQKCQFTDPNCVSCLSASPSNCSKCANSYYLDKLNQTCVLCSTFDSNCMTCLGINLCTQCNQGYYVLSTTTNQQNSGMCYKCNLSCLTCKYSPQFCTSCAPGYQLTLNNKCLNQIKIIFTIVLDANYDSVLNSFMTQIYDNLAQLFGLLNSNEIEISSVVKGSIRVIGYLHMPAGQRDPNAFLQNIKVILASNSKAGQYSILSSNAQFATTNNSSAFNGNGGNGIPMAVLIGVAAGGGVFAIVVIIVLVWAIRKYGCKKASKEQAKEQNGYRNKKQESQKSNKSTKNSTNKRNVVDESQRQIVDPPANGF